MYCRLIRGFISNALDSDRDNSAFVRKHIDACPGCRQFYERSQAVAHKLINDAPCVENTADFSVPPKHEPGMRYGLVFAPALICLILIGFFLLRTRPERVRPEDSEWLIAEVGQLADKTVGLLPENALAREIMLMAEDSKHAVGSLIACTGFDPDTIMVAIID